MTYQSCYLARRRKRRRREGLRGQATCRLGAAWYRVILEYYLNVDLTFDRGSGFAVLRGVKKTPPSRTPPVGSDRFFRLSFGSGRGDGIRSGASGAGAGGATDSGASNSDATASTASSFDGRDATDASNSEAPASADGTSNSGGAGAGASVSISNGRRCGWSSVASSVKSIFDAIPGSDIPTLL